MQIKVSVRTFDGGFQLATGTRPCIAYLSDRMLFDIAHPGGQLTWSRGRGLLFSGKEKHTYRTQKASVRAGRDVVQ
jgi:hypothetical protein